MKTASASALATTPNLLSLTSQPALPLPSSRRDGEGEQGEAEAEAEARASKSRSKREGAKDRRYFAPEYSAKTEANVPVALDLFAAVVVVDEHTLGKRLLQLGADLYCDGEFATPRDRLRHVIVREQFAHVICGRDPAGDVETCAQAFARVCGEALAQKRKPRQEARP